MKKVLIIVMVMLSTSISFAQYTHPVGCHYRLIIETESYNRAIFSKEYTDTVCNKEYEGLGNLLHDMKILLNRLAKEKEYNDVNYKIYIENITNKLTVSDIFPARFWSYNDEKYINEKINKTLEEIKQRVFKYSEVKRLNLYIKYTDKRTLQSIYADKEDCDVEYIFDEEELTFKKREKKKQL